MLDFNPKEYLSEKYYSAPRHKKLSAFAGCSQLLLKYKYHYYIVDDPLVSDTEYDKLERTYRAMADDLGLKPVIYDMVGFDFKIEGTPIYQEAE